MADRTVTVNGFSKAYAMTGWRLGYLAATEGLVTQASKVHTHSVTCATNFVQHAGIEALENSKEEVDRMVEAFRDQRDLLVDLLKQSGVSIRPLEGAFYVMVPVADDDKRWCKTALEEAHVATVPGRAFGAPGYARFSYTCGKDRLREAVDRLVGNGLLQ